VYRKSYGMIPFLTFLVAKYKAAGERGFPISRPDVSLSGSRGLLARLPRVARGLAAGLSDGISLGFFFELQRRKFVGGAELVKFVRDEHLLCQSQASEKRSRCGRDRSPRRWRAAGSDSKPRQRWAESWKYFVLIASRHDPHGAGGIPVLGVASSIPFPHPLHASARVTARAAPQKTTDSIGSARVHGSRGVRGSPLVQFKVHPFSVASLRRVGSSRFNALS